jgi:DnaJ-class molecular chaperone
MTLKSARRLLGVTAISSRKEIKTAYRKMASQWHPDRLGFRTESVRRIATEQMAAINEAYHLLRSCLPQGPVGFGPD